MANPLDDADTYRLIREAEEDYGRAVCHDCAALPRPVADGDSPFSAKLKIELAAARRFSALRPCITRSRTPIRCTASKRTMIRLADRCVRTLWVRLID